MVNKFYCYWMKNVIKNFVSNLFEPAASISGKANHSPNTGICPIRYNSKVGYHLCLNDKVLPQVS